jgi:hypothetical protein
LPAAKSRYRLQSRSPTRIRNGGRRHSIKTHRNRAGEEQRPDLLGV